MLQIEQDGPTYLFFRSSHYFHFQADKLFGQNYRLLARHCQFRIGVGSDKNLQTPDSTPNRSISRGQNSRLPPTQTPVSTPTQSAS